MKSGSLNLLEPLGLLWDSFTFNFTTSKEENKAVTLWEEEFWDISSLFMCNKK